MISIQIVNDTPEVEVRELRELMDAKSIYDDIYELQDRVAALEADTGWIDLPLATGIEAYSDNNKPQYRKVGKVVFLRGVVKGITSPNMVLGTLPVGFRPTMATPFTQNTSIRSTNLAMYSRMIIGQNGTVRLEFISDGAEYAPDKWFPIGTSFVID